MQERRVIQSICSSYVLKGIYMHFNYLIYPNTPEIWQLEGAASTIEQRAGEDENSLGEAEFASLITTNIT